MLVDEILNEEWHKNPETKYVCTCKQVSMYLSNNLATLYCLFIRSGLLRLSSFYKVHNNDETTLSLWSGWVRQNPTPLDQILWWIFWQSFYLHYGCHSMLCPIIMMAYFIRSLIYPFKCLLLQWLHLLLSKCKQI